MNRTNELAHKVVFLELGSEEGKYIVYEQAGTRLLFAAMIRTILRHRNDCSHRDLLTMFEDAQRQLSSSSPYYVGPSSIEQCLEWYKNPDLKTAMKGTPSLPDLSDDRHILGGGQYRYNGLHELILEGESSKYGKPKTEVLKQFEQAIQNYCNERNLPLRCILFR